MIERGNDLRTQDFFENAENRKQFYVSLRETTSTLFENTFDENGVVGLTTPRYRFVLGYGFLLYWY